MQRCDMCDAPYEGTGEYCPACMEAVEYEEETEEIEIGRPSNAKLTKGFRMMKGE